MNELALALNLAKPTIVLKGSGGWSDILSEEKLLEGLKRRPYIAQSAKEAVELAFSFCFP